MKNIITIFAGLMLTAGVFAQSPQKMSYQAIIRNSSNNLVSNHMVGMRISILQDSASGIILYVETQTPTTDANGLISIEIGGGTVVNGNFSGIDWAKGPYFIKTETDPAGGVNYTITGTSQLLSVPYTLYANIADGRAGVHHYIGEHYGGGVIFYLWKNTAGIEHGLIVTLNILSSSQKWSDVTTVAIGASAESTWDGLSNSNAITGQPGVTTSAAQLCLDWVSGGQSDWYLPAIDELSLLYQHRFDVNRALSNITGADVLDTKNEYWSSNESLGSPVHCAMTFDFRRGVPNEPTSKNFPKYVRAIRAF